MLTHVNDKNQPAMVNVSDKAVTYRKAKACCSVKLPPEVANLFVDGDLTSKKGPVFHTAIIAGTLAAKKTHELIPFCHPIPLENCKIEINFTSQRELKITAEVSATHKTGVEMEALCAVNVAALTIYDMCKAVSHDIRIQDVYLLEKSGGKSEIKNRPKN